MSDGVRKTKYQALEESIAEIKEKLESMGDKPVEVENLDFDAMIKEIVTPLMSDVLERLETVEKRFDSQVNKGIPVSQLVGEDNIETIMRTGDDLVDKKGNVSPRPSQRIVENTIVNLP